MSATFFAVSALNFLFGNPIVGVVFLASAVGCLFVQDDEDEDEE